MALWSDFRRSIIRYFRKRKFEDKEAREVFTAIYTSNMWNSVETVSGPGSELRHTCELRNELRQLLENLKVSSITDCGCGDFNWMKEVVNEQMIYHGIDVVQELEQQNTTRYGSESRMFFTGDLSTCLIVHSDVLICRDVLVHLTNAQIEKVLRNFYLSGCRWLLITSFNNSKNTNSHIGDWRPINLELEPFSLPSPVRIIRDQTAGNKSGIAKGLYLWERVQLEGNALFTSK